MIGSDMAALPDDPWDRARLDRAPKPFAPFWGRGTTRCGMLRFCRRGVCGNECALRFGRCVPSIMVGYASRILVVALSAAAHAALIPAPLGARPATVQRRRSLPAPVLALDELDDDDELDALDTVSLWDEELAEMKAWEAAQAAKKQSQPDVGAFFDSGTGVDEDAHLGLGDDDDDDDDAGTALWMLRQLESQQGKAAPKDETRIMTSLESVLNAISRLSDKIDRVESKVDKLLSAPPRTDGGAPPQPSAEVKPQDGASPAEGGWDGVVDEEAWFDDVDEDDLPDWRDVRKLKRMFEQSGDEVAPKEEETGDGSEDDADEVEDA